MFERILVPLDGSKFSEQAFPYAFEVAKRFGAEIALLQVISPTPFISASMPIIEAGPVFTEPLAQAAQKQDRLNASRASRYLQKKQQEVAEQGLKASRLVVIGVPADSILKICQQQKIDLIVMTTHGRSGLKRAFVGSVADKIIRDSGIPVLTIHPK